MALVITGSEDYGFMTSLQLNDVAWMRKIKSVIQDRKLHHVVMPGSHDAGMSVIAYPNAPWWNGGAAYDTETQALDLYNQLRVGARYFDMRFVKPSYGKFWAAHMNSDDGVNPLGALGETLDNLIAGVNRFTREYPGEVIIWYMKYLRDLGVPVIGNGMMRILKSFRSASPSGKSLSRC